MRVLALFGIVSFLLLRTTPLCGQQFNWQTLERTIQEKNELNRCKKQLDSLLQLPIRRDRYPEIARAVQNRLQIDDQRSEDSLYFYNSCQLDSLIAQYPDEPGLSNLLYLIRYRRIQHYLKTGNHNRKAALLKNGCAPVSYKYLTTDQLRQMARQDLLNSIRFSGRLPDYPLQQLIWISSNLARVLFKPSFKDLLYSEAVQEFYIQYGNTPREVINTLLEQTPDQLLSQNFADTRLSKDREDFYHTLSEWQHGYVPESEQWQCIDLLARHYLYSGTSYERRTYTRYASVLYPKLQSSYLSVKNTALLELALQLNEQGRQYIQNTYWDGSGYHKTFDSTYRWNYRELLQMIDRHISATNSFPIVRRKLMILRAERMQRSLSLQISDVVLPDQPIKLGITAANADTLLLKIVRLPAATLTNSNPQLNYRQLQQYPLFRTDTIYAPENQDFQTHQFEVMLQGLHTGVYAIVPELNDMAEPQQVTLIQVSAITTLVNEEQVFVLHRNTGIPLKGARVQPWIDTGRNRLFVALASKTADHKGMVVFSDSRIRKITVTLGDDTLTKSCSFEPVKPSNALFDPTSGDDLVDYFSENTSVHFYLDRGIYRPGQEVHFKAIVVTRNPLTGKMMVLNRDNVRVRGLRKWRMTWEDLKDLIPDSVKVYITDPFYKYTDTLTVPLNQFGSVSGTFKLPDEAATGSWDIGIDDSDLDWDEVRDKSFRVEAYKRPNYQLQIEEPLKNLQAGDSFTIKVRCVSFTDQPLAGVQITATLNLQFSSLGKRNNGIPLTQQQGESIDLIDDSSFTSNEKGEVLIHVPVQFLNQYYLDSMHAYNFRYYLEVEAIDASGESHEKNQTFTLYSMPLDIQVTSSSVQECSAVKPFYYRVQYRKGSQVDKAVQVAVYQQITQTGDTNESPADYILIGGKWTYRYPEMVHPSTVQEVLLYQTQLNAGVRQWSPDSLHLKAGTYFLQLQVIESGQLKASRRVPFSLFDQQAGTYPGDKKLFEFATARDVVPGDTVRVYFGQPNRNVYTITQFRTVLLTRKGSRVINTFQCGDTRSGIELLQYPVPANATGEVSVTRLFVLNNEVYQQQVRVSLLPGKDQEPEIVLNHFKSVTAPGAHESWKISVSTASPEVATELMTTLYDARLDQLEPLHWELPYQHIYWSITPRWTNQITQSQNSGYYFYNSISPGKSEAPLWWLNPLGESYSMSDGDGIEELLSVRRDITGSLQGVSAGQLNEVVVVGYGTVSRKTLVTSAMVRVRGISSLTEYGKKLVVLDGVVYSGDLSAIDPNLIQEGLVLNGIEATAIFGSRAAEGVLIISTKGPIRLEDLKPPVPPPPPFKPRKNFAELAYFSPALSVDSSGKYSMEFTLPESVTSWNWKLLAHTQDGRFAQLSRKIISSLPLMLEPRLPRLLYQGDEVQLPVRIIQTGADSIQADVSVQATDAVTGEPITALLMNHSSQTIQVPANGSGTLYFTLQVPDDFLHPIRITAKASTNGFSDGEERELPVLSRRILVAQTTSFMLQPGSDTVVALPALPGDAQMTGAALLIQPKPYAGMLNALPYLTDYPYGCAEQTFNKLYGYWLARKLVREDTALQASLNRHHEAGQTHSEEAPREPAAAYMPWLQLARQTRKQQQDLRRVLDTIQGWKRTQELLTQLYRLQLNDGGITWFPGGSAQPEISLYVLESCYRLHADSGVFTQDAAAAGQWNQFTDSLERYADRWFLNHHSWNSSLEEQYVLIRTGNGKPPSNELRIRIDSVMNRLWQKAGQLSLYRQAQLILASFRSGHSETLRKNAGSLLESIRQRAITDLSAGLRWKEVSDEDDFSTHSEEILALLGEAFWIDGRYTDCNDIIRWLFGNREYHHWGSTRSTAAIVRLLSRSVQPVLFSSNQLASDTGFRVNDGLLNGQFMDYQTQTAPDRQRIISCRSTNPASVERVAGSWQQYYLTERIPEDTLAPIRIQKQFWIRTGQGDAWRMLREQDSVRPGDLIQTRLILYSRTVLKYVYINDPRHGTLEPVNTESGYHYQNELAWYESVRDEGSAFFADQIPSGTTQIVYESKATQSGFFRCAPAVLQCLYRPDRKAYAPTAPIRVAPAKPL